VTTKTKAKRTQRERTETTTAALVAAARDLFARDGYRATSLDAIVEQSGVTKGALYHHFGGKEELFEAVFREEERRLCEAIGEAFDRKRDPVQGAVAGCSAYLEGSLDPGVQQIMLLDAPSVLGWERMRDIETEYGLALIKAGINHGIEQGRFRRRDVDSLAHLLFGALGEGAMFIARAEDQRAAKRSFERELKVMLQAFAG
jgi:AcrR family transcriptional regulator